jgi:hypothetical protein
MLCFEVAKVARFNFLWILGWLYFKQNKGSIWPFRKTYVLVWVATSNYTWTIFKAICMLCKGEQWLQV